MTYRIIFFYFLHKFISHIKYYPDRAILFQLGDWYGLNLINRMIELPPPLPPKKTPKNKNAFLLAKRNEKLSSLHIKAACIFDV